MNVLALERPQAKTKPLPNWLDTIKGRYNQKLLDHILANQTQPPKEVAEKFNVKPATVYWYRNYINRTGLAKLPNLNHAKKQAPYNAARVERHAALREFILDNPMMSPTMVAKKFDLSVSTATTYRWKLRKEGHDIPLLWRGNSGRHDGHRTRKPKQDTIPMQKSTPDQVNHPAHYTQGGIEAIDYIRAKLTPDEFSGYCKGNALKYISRAGKKTNESEDLAKAKWYLDHLLAVREGS